MVRTCVVVIAVALSGCDVPPPTYARDVKPILDGKCVSCHQEGGAGPFSLRTWADVEPRASAIAGAVSLGLMPPWFADPECNTYARDRRLSDDEKATIEAWNEAGAPAGDVSAVAATAVPAPALPRVDYDLALEGPYFADKRDVYRCYTVLMPNDAPTYVTGYDVVPGAPSIVHHVNVFLTAPDKTPEFVDKQAQDVEPGFNCALGRMDTGSGLLGAWAPGAQAVVYPDASGILIEPGASLVLEVHYHVAGGERVPDQSRILLMTSDTVERRGLGGAIYDFINWPGQNGMTIEAGDAESVHEYELDPAPFVQDIAPWLTSDRVRFHVAGLHMHYLGKSASLWVRRPDENVCLLDIPDWDFDWQMGYELQTPVELLIGRDTIYVECTFDNSAANQPIVDGERQQVEERHWGSSTTDEMCMGLFYVTEG